MIKLVFSNVTIVIPYAQNLSCSDHELWSWSNDPEELAYYNKIRKEMDDMKKEPFKRGIPLNWDNPEVIHK